MWPSASTPDVYGLQNEKTLILNGQSGVGKSEFCHGLGREIALRKNKPAYGGGTIDKYGAVTKANQMYDIGAPLVEAHTS